MKKRTLALIMALVLMLSVAIPGTLAVSLDGSESTTSTFSAGTLDKTAELVATAVLYTSTTGNGASINLSDIPDAPKTFTIISGTVVDGQRWYTIDTAAAFGDDPNYLFFIYVKAHDVNLNTKGTVDTSSLTLTGKGSVEGQGESAVSAYAKTLTAAPPAGAENAATQWQINIGGDKWANIQGAGADTLGVSYGLVASMLDSSNEAQLRCTWTVDGIVYCSEPVTVTYDEPAEPETTPAAEDAGKSNDIEKTNTDTTAAQSLESDAQETRPVLSSRARVLRAPAEADIAPLALEPEQPVTEQPDAPAAVSDTEVEPTEPTEPTPTPEATEAPTEENTPAAADTYTANEDMPAVQDENDGVAAVDENPVAPANYSIIINYVFTDGSQAANPWTGSIGAGMSYHQEVKSPEVVGYTPDQESIDVNITGADKDLTYTVTYKPALVSFKVEHWQQNTDNDQYTLVSTDSKTGYTESEVGVGLGNEYTGFYDLLYDTSMKIAADSSTVVKIYYDRYYYLMSFDLQGGYGTDPIYARYGAAIGTVPDPIRAGYTFKGWDKTIPSTMPAEKTKFTASWEAQQATLTVAFWYENANDDNYSVAGSIEVDPKPLAGKEVKSEDYKNTNFTGRDKDHFTFNAEKSETKTVDGDGSTVLNVYFTRNTYTITFPEVQMTTTCGKEEHTHTYDGSYTTGSGFSRTTYYYGGCYPAGSSGNRPGSSGTGGATKGNVICGKEEHTHSEGSIWSDGCLSYSDYTVTRKYDADISDVWETDPIKSLLDDGYVFKSSLTGVYYSFLEKMPGSDITMTKTEWSGNTYTWYYYLEVPSGMSAPAGAETKTDGGKTYYKYHTTTIKGSSVSLTYDEDYFPITGFTQRDAKGENGWNKQGDVYKHSFDSGRTYSLYYLRNKYNLKFINYGTEVTGKGGDYYYQQDISGTNFTPDYPDTLEKDAYVFDGWYDNPFFNESGKFDFTGATMPAGPVILYAHWVPKTHNVEVYKTSDMKAEDKIGDTQVVPHRDLATEPETPTHPSSDKYEFVGWFYLTDDTTPVEKAFDFSMPISKDMKIYAKWSSNVMVDYTIKYVLEDGTEIAPATTGKNLAGTTKTFDAKVGEELDEGYRSGYFPTTNSHNLELNIEGENTYSFIYIPKEKVPYTVKYLEVGTEKVLKEEKHAETRDAVITEKFEFIQGYAPDAYQKRLILSANEEENVIIFWYVADTEHAPVQIIHWTQNISGDSYTEYTSNTILNGVIGTTYTETPKTIEGFQYRLSTEGSSYVSNPSGQLTGEGLVLNLYYDRIEYPYEFKFLEQGTDKVLATATTGNARYQAQVTEKAKTIPGYTLVSDENQAITIAIEDPANVAKKNVKIFYYQEETIEIKYQVVGPDGCGTLSSYADQNVKVFTGTVNGSTPTANDGFRFVGWYKDAACTEAVTESWVVENKITPEKTTTIGTQQAFEAATYYAKFEYNVADLTITKTGANETVDPNQTFIFTITGTKGYSTKVVIKGNGSVTIKNLEIDTYTIHEENGWSWRYNCEDQTVTLQPGVTNNVTMTNNRDETKWLDGNAYVENKFNK